MHDVSFDDSITVSLVRAGDIRAIAKLDNSPGIPFLYTGSTRA